MLLSLVCSDETWMCFCEMGAAMSYFGFRTVCGIAKPEWLELLQCYSLMFRRLPWEWEEITSNDEVEPHKTLSKTIEYDSHSVHWAYLNLLLHRVLAPTLTEHAGSLAQSLTFLMHFLAHQKAVWWSWSLGCVSVSINILYWYVRVCWLWLSSHQKGERCPGTNWRRFVRWLAMSESEDDAKPGRGKITQRHKREMKAGVMWSDLRYWLSSLAQALMEQKRIESGRGVPWA